MAMGLCPHWRHRIAFGEGERRGVEACIGGVVRLKMKGMLEKGKSRGREGGGSERGKKERKERRREREREREREKKEREREKRKIEKVNVLGCIFC